MILCILKRQILDPVWRMLVLRLSHRTVKRIEVIEENDGNAARNDRTVVRQIGEGVWWQGPLGRLLSREGGVGRENADGLRLAAVEDGEIFFPKIGDGAVLVANNHANLYQASRNANLLRLRRVLRCQSQRHQQGCNHS